MPLITIQSLAPADPAVIPEMLTQIRDQGAAALRCSPSNIWVIFEPVLPRHYLQGQNFAELPQDKTHPPIIIIRAQSGRSNEDREALVKVAVQSVAQGLAIPPENVWVHYQEMRPQDVWFEGHWAGSSGHS